MVIVVASAPAAHAACDDHFPEQPWERIGETEVLTVSAVGLGESQALRYSNEANTMMLLLEQDFGPLPALDLCIYGPDVRLDPTGLAPPGQLLHAAVFNESRTIYISALQPRFFTGNQAFGLAYAALWNVAMEEGQTGYPEPLATTIGQWYLARVTDKLELHHSQMRGGAFFRDPSGEGIDALPWATNQQPAVYVWNPQFQESPMSDFIAYAVRTHGPEVLRDLDGERWADIEAAWSGDLREEALEGRSSGNAWMIGLAIVIGSVALAVLVAWLARRQRIRAHEEARARAAEEAKGSAIV